MQFPISAHTHGCKQLTKGLSIYLFLSSAFALKKTHMTINSCITCQEQAAFYQLQNCDHYINIYQKDRTFIMSGDKQTKNMRRLSILLFWF